jgi:hypothetical protein
VNEEVRGGSGAAPLAGMARGGRVRVRGWRSARRYAHYTHRGVDSCLAMGMDSRLTAAAGCCKRRRSLWTHVWLCGGSAPPARRVQGLQRAPGLQSHSPSPGRLNSDQLRESRARQASGAAAAAMSQREAQRALNSSAGANSRRTATAATMPPRCRTWAPASNSTWCPRPRPRPLYQAASWVPCCQQSQQLLATMAPVYGSMTTAVPIGLTTASQMPWRSCGSAMQRFTRSGWTATEPAPATSGTATCASRGTPLTGTTGLPSGVPTRPATAEIKKCLRALPGVC